MDDHEQSEDRCGGDGKPPQQVAHSECDEDDQPHHRGKHHGRSASSRCPTEVCDEQRQQHDQQLFDEDMAPMSEPKINAAASSSSNVVDTLNAVSQSYPETAKSRNNTNVTAHAVSGAAVHAR